MLPLKEQAVSMVSRMAGIRNFVNKRVNIIDLQSLHDVRKSIKYLYGYCFVRCAFSSSPDVPSRRASSVATSSGVTPCADHNTIR